MTNTAPTANDDFLDSNDAAIYTVTEDDVLKVNMPKSVLANDTDTDGDKLAAYLASFPHNPLFDFKTNGTFTYDARFHGDLYLDTSTYTLTSDTTKFLLPDGFDSLGAGAVIYDTYTYKATDGLASSGPATVTIVIEGQNDDPVAAGDFADVKQATDSEVVIDVLANDTDVDIWPTRDDQNFSIVALNDLADGSYGAGGSDSSPADGLEIVTAEGGTVSLGADNKLHYAAAAGFFGIDTFEYTVDDGHGGTDTAVVRVTVWPDNAVPVANDDSY